MDYLALFTLIVFLGFLFFCYKTLSFFYKKIFKREKKIKNIEIVNFKEEEFGFNNSYSKISTSDTIQKLLKRNKKSQIEEIKNGNGIICHTNWHISGNYKEGNKMTQNSIKLTAIAFNNQCDAIMSKVTWKNFEASRKKIITSCNTINRLNKENTIEITKDYLELKIEELQLTHEYEEKKQEEKEIQAEIKAQMREEQKVQKELEKVIREEEKFNKALLLAKESYEKANNEEKLKLKKEINDLNKKLEKTQRAKSMAQQTKTGHVYVISNEGSFGKNVFKIGMTRRLEPQDRVKELGDASVPFEFDVHAMIYSKDAPKLEKELHNIFSEKRINKINKRKEFFNVSLMDIKKEVEKRDSNIKFIMNAEAKEYKLSKDI